MTRPLWAGLPKWVRIYEVGPRDGLQNEARLVPTADKIALLDRLSQTGIAHIEATSFVSPKWIPQLADALEVTQKMARAPGVTYSALVPNKKGLEAAMAAKLPEIAVFMSASETHNKKNVNKTIAETLTAFGEVIPPALAAGMSVRAYVSTVYGCPFEGDVKVSAVTALVRELLAMGVYQVSLGDTIGVANPVQVGGVLEEVLRIAPLESIGVHFHDTRGTALANVLASIQMGISTVDSTVGGLGGCPYAPGAAGNVATEDVVYMLEGMGIDTGVDLEVLLECSRQVSEIVGRELPSKMLRAHLGELARPQLGRHLPGKGKHSASEKKGEG